MKKWKRPRPWGSWKEVWCYTEEIYKGNATPDLQDVISVGYDGKGWQAFVCNESGENDTLTCLPVKTAKEAKAMALIMFGHYQEKEYEDVE